MSLHLPDVHDYLAFHDFVEKRRRGTFAQNFQDLFVLWALGEVRSGTFVEFGADDGVTGSNTLLLEREFAWTGLLLEPNRSCHESLAKTRRCHVDHRAVFHTSGQSLRFIESTHRQLSHLASSGNPNSSCARAASYEVDTVTLDDALHQYRIPPGFNLLSIDVEGAELDVLSGFHIECWQPRVVVIEHNSRTTDKRRIEAFFSEAGYAKHLPGFSRNDLWFVRGCETP